MKTLIFISVFVVYSLITCAQVTEIINGSYEILRNNKKGIRYHRLIDSDDACADQSDFFKGILCISKDDEFRFLKRGNDRSGKYFEEYRQYYEGIRVKSGVFILHWNNGLDIHSLRLFQMCLFFPLVLNCNTLRLLIAF